MKLKFILIIVMFFSSFKAQSFEKQTRYGDRFYIFQVLKDVFGPSSESILKENVLNHPEVFGGPCSLMEEVLIEDEKTQAPKQLSSEFTCHQGLSESKSPMYTRAALVRNSHMHKTCLLLSSELKSVSYALRDTFLAPTEIESVSILIKRFYPFHDNTRLFSQKLVQDLNMPIDYSNLNEDVFLENFLRKNLTPKPISSKLFLRNLLYLLCISEEWQIP